MAYYYNVKITDLLSVDKLDESHQFLIANPIVVDGTIDSRTPYTSNRISGKEISSSICGGMANMIKNSDFDVSGDWNMYGKWTFKNENKIPAVDAKIDPTDLTNALSDDAKLSSVINDDGNGWYASLTNHRVLTGNGVDSLSIGNNSIPNINYVERTVAQTYKISKNYTDDLRSWTSVELNKKANIIATESDFKYRAQIWFGRNDLNPIPQGTDETILSNYFGVFSPNVKQWYTINGEHGSRPCIDISTNKSTALFKEENCGKVMSDGTYFYYKVAQDCTLFLKIQEDFVNASGETTVAYLLCNTRSNLDGGNHLNQTKVVQIGKAVELFAGTGNDAFVTFPVPRGTVVMIGIYMRQYMPGSWASSEYGWQSALQAPLVKEVLYGDLTSLYSDPGFDQQSATYYIENGSKELSTFRLPANGDLRYMNRVFEQSTSTNTGGDPNTNRYYYTGKTFTTVAEIIEMI